MRARSLPLLAGLVLVSAMACGDSGGGPTPPACQSPAGTADPPTIQTLVATRATVGQQVTFDVPANTASITLVEEAVSAPATVTFVPTGGSAIAIDNLAVPFWVKDPSGTKVYDDNQDFSHLSQTQIEQLTAYAAGVGPAIGTITIPNTTGGFRLLCSSGQPGLAAGTWSLQVSDLAWECTLPQSGGSCSGGSTTSTYDVTVIAKRSVNGAIPAAGALDVVVYFATTSAGSGQPLSAATANAGNDTNLNRMVQTLKGLLGTAGITVRSTTFVDLPASVQAQYATGVDISTTDANSPLALLLKNGANGKALNVFFVSAFTGADLVAGKAVVGLDGTIPGPATVGGSPGSGVAVATVDLRSGTPSVNAACNGGFSLACGADLTAYYIAHETGHYLGLYHTTEMNGFRFDPLAGTPTCACSACKTSSDTIDRCATSSANATSSSHTMTVAECTSTTRPSCGGGDNLMFWTLGNSSRGKLEAEQKSVILTSPLLQ